MTTYYIRASKIPSVYTLAKFEDGAQRPSDTYHVYMGWDSTGCNCPSYQDPCKHVDMVKKWLALPVDTELDRIGWIYTTEGDEPFIRTPLNLDELERHLNVTGLKVIRFD